MARRNVDARDSPSPPVLQVSNGLEFLFDYADADQNLLRTLNCSPGPFNIKEHTLITVMANVSAQSAYATGATSLFELVSLRHS